MDDGQFISRSDLIDAPTCALARGAPVAGLGENSSGIYEEQMYKLENVHAYILSR